MDDTQFEALLASAYRAPSERIEPPELMDRILARAERRRRIRRAKLALATLVGVGVAVLAFAATGVAGKMGRALASAGPEPTLIDPTICLAVGFFLMLLAAARNELRDF